MLIFFEKKLGIKERLLFSPSSRQTILVFILFYATMYHEIYSIKAAFNHAHFLIEFPTRQDQIARKNLG